MNDIINNMKEQSSITDNAASQSGFYHAATVLTLFVPKNFLYAVVDCYVAAQNIMLAVHSLGVGSCMVVRAEDAFSSELGRRSQKGWSIDETYEEKIHVTLGYLTNSGQPRAKPYKEGRIKRITQ
jgi:nitroreductase